MFPAVLASGPGKTSPPHGTSSTLGGNHYRHTIVEWLRKRAQSCSISASAQALTVVLFFGPLFLNANMQNANNGLLQESLATKLREVELFSKAVQRSGTNASTTNTLQTAATQVVPPRLIMTGASVISRVAPSLKFVISMTLSADATESATTLQGLVDNEPLAICQVNPDGASATILGHDGADGEPPVTFKVGKSFFLRTPISKLIKLGDDVAATIAEHLADHQGNPAPPLPIPDGPGAAPQLANQLATFATGASTRATFTLRLTLLWLFDTPELFNKFCCPGADPPNAPGTLATYSPPQEVITYKDALRQLQPGKLHAATDFLTEAVAQYIHGFQFGPGKDQTSVRIFAALLPEGHDTKADKKAPLPLTVAITCARYLAKYCAIVFGPTLGALISALATAIQDAVDFEPTHGARFLLLFEALLDRVHLVPSPLPPTFGSKRDWLAHEWDVTADSAIIATHKAAFMADKLKALEKATATLDDGFTAVGSKRQRRGRETTPERPRADRDRADKPKPRASLKEVRAWHDKRPSFVGADERVMCKAVAMGRECTNPNCRSNHKWAEGKPDAEIKAVTAWVKASPYGK